MAGQAGTPFGVSIILARAALPIHVVAYAYAYQGVVVSEEKPRASGRGDVKIPDVCEQLGVRHVNLLELFRVEGFTDQL